MEASLPDFLQSLFSKLLYYLLFVVGSMNPYECYLFFSFYEIARVLQSKQLDFIRTADPSL